MRTIKLVVLGLLAAILIAIGAANMVAVDLYLLPVQLFGEAFSVKGIPLAVVIFASVLLGILVGLMIEFLREGLQRRLAAEKRREIVELRQELTRLRARMRDHDEDLPRIPAE